MRPLIQETKGILLCKFGPNYVNFNLNWLQVCTNSGDSCQLLNLHFVVFSDRAFRLKDMQELYREQSRKLFNFNLLYVTNMILYYILTYNLQYEHTHIHVEYLCFYVLSNETSNQDSNEINHR